MGYRLCWEAALIVSCGLLKTSCMQSRRRRSPFDVNLFFFLSEPSSHPSNYPLCSWKCLDGEKGKREREREIRLKAQKFWSSL